MTFKQDRFGQYWGVAEKPREPFSWDKFERFVGWLNKAPWGRVVAGDTKREEPVEEVKWTCVEPAIAQCSLHGYQWVENCGPCPRCEAERSVAMKPHDGMAAAGAAHYESGGMYRDTAPKADEEPRESYTIGKPFLMEDSTFKRWMKERRGPFDSGKPDGAISIEPKNALLDAADALAKAATRAMSFSCIHLLPNQVEDACVTALAAYKAVKGKR